MPGKVWPMKRDTFWLSSGAGPRWGRYHRGLDLASNGGVYGTPIYAAADGIVVHVGINDDPEGFGSWMVIDHQDGFGVDTVYGHMPPSSFQVRQGDRVQAGQHIANVGSEGSSTGPHLHFEVWSAPGRYGGQFMDPEPWLVDAAYPGEQLFPPAPVDGDELEEFLSTLSPQEFATVTRGLLQWNAPQK